MGDLFVLAISCILINNILLAQYLGNCPFLGTSKKMVYLSQEQQVILTDNAKAWQNQSMVSGDKIIYYLDEGRSEVIGNSSATTEGSKETGDKKPSRVNMTIRQD